MDTNRHECKKAPRAFRRGRQHRAFALVKPATQGAKSVRFGNGVSSSALSLPAKWDARILLIPLLFAFAPSGEQLFALDFGQGQELGLRISSTIGIVSEVRVDDDEEVRMSLIEPDEHVTPNRGSFGI